MMNSIIPAHGDQVVVWPAAHFLCFSFFLRGHNEPGGGFIGGSGRGNVICPVCHCVRTGKIAGNSQTGSTGIDWLRDLIRCNQWHHFHTAWYAFHDRRLGLCRKLGGSVLHLGTPIIFDIGVYLVVVGFTLGVIFSLEEEK